MDFAFILAAFGGVCVLVLLLGFACRIIVSLLKIGFTVVFKVPISILLIVIGIVFCCTIILIPLGILFIKAGIKIWG